MDDISKALGFSGGTKLETVVGSIPKQIEDACKRPTNDDYVLDLSYLLSGFEPNDINVKVHGHVVEVDAKKAGDEDRDTVVEFTLPDNVDTSTLKTYFCGNNHRVIIYGKLKK